MDAQQGEEGAPEEHQRYFLEGSYDTSLSVRYEHHIVRRLYHREVSKYFLFVCIIFNFNYYLYFIMNIFKLL